MKIAHIVGKFPNLSETFVLNLITGLIDIGHEGEIFSIKNSKKSIMHKGVKNYNLIERTYYYSGYSHVVFKIADILKHLIINLFTRPLFSLKLLAESGDITEKIKAFWRADPLIDKGFDIIHAHFGNVGAGSIFLKRFVDCPFIVSFHANDVTMVPIENPGIYKNLFKETDLVTAVSLDKKQSLIDLGCPENKVAIQHVGVNLKEFKYIERRSGKNTKFLLVGRLAEKKGIKFAIKAFAMIIKEFQNIELRIIGDGPLKNDLTKLVSQLNIEDEVFFLGSQTSSVVREEMQVADIFVLPSITTSTGDTEGVPVVLMEAQATGLPVISTYHSGIPEVVLDGKSGFLVLERDVNTLSEKMKFLIENPKLRFKMGNAGRKHIEKNYNFTIEIKKLENLYEGILHKK